MNILAIILAGTLALSLGISYPMMSLAQEDTQSEEQLPDQIEVPMNLTLKLKDGGNEEVNGTESRDVTVNLMVQSGKDGSPTEIPITAKVSNDTSVQDLELCAIVQGANEMCNSVENLVKASEDNSEDSQANATESNESSDETSSSDNSTENGENEDN